MIAPLELAANVFTALAIVLAGRNNVHTWWTGIVGCTLFGVLFGQTRLYADVALQAFFVATGVVGWWKWVRGDHGDPLPITHASAANLAWTVPLGLAATAGYGALLHFTTNAYAPFLDSAVLVFSIIGQVLMMVNSIAAPLYLSRGLVLTAVLYAGFWINAIVSWRNWHRLAAQPLLSESPST